MIVTCHACDTSFQLDETRVPVQGIRVRCSRCKEAFFLEHPSTSQSEALHEVASEAAEAGAIPPPDSTQDLPPSKVVEQDDEADWEFNHEPVAEGESVEADEASIGDVSVEGGSGLSLADESESVVEAEPELDGDASALPADESAALAVEAESGDESAFGSVDDFSSLMEEDPDQQLDESISIEDDTSLLDGLDDIDVSDHDAGQYAESGVADELGEPENWDFFSEGSAEGSSTSAQAGQPSGAAIGRVALGSIAASGASVDDSDEASDHLYENGAASAGKLLAMGGYAAHAAGWALALGLFGAGLLSGLWPTAQAMIETPQVIDLNEVRADSIRGSWVETARAGTLLEVTGVLHNRTRKPQPLNDVFQVELITADGHRLDVTPAPAGLVLPEPDVRELPKDELWSAQNNAAYALTRTTLEPGGQMPFQALFADVPTDAVRFAMARTPSTGVAPVPANSVSQAVAVDGAVDMEGDGAPASELAVPAPESAAGAASNDAGELTWGE